MTHIYTCAACGNTYDGGESNEEAILELEFNFGVPVEECDVVCDDCYPKLLEFIKNNG